MRALLALAGCIVLSAGDLARLPQLEESNRFFELRAELNSSRDNAGDLHFYRAMANSRFGAEQEAIAQLRKFLAAKPAPGLERKARHELSAALTRVGEYAQAATEYAAWLTLAGATERDAQNADWLLSALKGVPKQTIEFAPPTPVQARRNPLGLWEVPVNIHSQRGEWIFDTGANFSTVSESEARRMGLTVREVNGSVRDFEGATRSARVAVAGELRFGSARLHNVVLLVLPDETLFIAPAKYQIRGIVGVPVMRALESVEVSAEGAVTYRKGASAKRVQPNLFFDWQNPIAGVSHSGHNLQMMLDTGAVATVLYPSMLDAFAQWERDQLNGANLGGAAQREIEFVPFIQLEPAGRTVYLNRISLLTKAPPATSGRDGILGIDALKDGFRLDFGAMRLTLN